MGIAILIGTLFRYFAEGKGARQRGESILVAAGLITGAALLDLVLGVAIRYGFDEKALAVAQFAELGDMVKTAATIGAFLIVGGVIFKNSKGAEPKQ